MEVEDIYPTAYIELTGLIRAEALLACTTDTTLSLLHDGKVDPILETVDAEKRLAEVDEPGRPGVSSPIELIETNHDIQQSSGQWNSINTMRIGLQPIQSTMNAGTSVYTMITQHLTQKG